MPDKTKTINLNSLENDVMTALYDVLSQLGFDKSGKDIDYPKRTITHNQLNYCLKYIYSHVFKPDQKLISNKQSVIEYDNISQLQFAADLFLNICAMYNKSLGLMSFSYFTGIDYKTIYNWMSPNGEKSNPARFQVLKYIQESHKAAQIGLLNDSPVGALAVANNDVETGLEWSRNNVLQAASNTVFLLSSERAEKLRLAAPETVENVTE